ncbi:hypothetical protein [Microbacterium hydrocarbonoxydans]|uniref:hypothetical protein n=1 Tax=Microbacterium hydrocarbonoxydans TaxID=273678 RepID=UPI0013DCFEC5|nr:hypothetical protein [Microbacterium hydrocarbonoxydans]
MSEEADAGDRGPRRRTARAALIGVTAAAGLLVIAAVGVIVAGRGTATYPEGSPERAVQVYAQAVVDGDLDVALGLLVPEDAEECERIVQGRDDYRVALVESTERGDSARVEVIISEVYSSGPFGPEEYSSEEVFGLRREGGAWLIETAPWQFAVCEEGGIR